VLGDPGLLVAKLLKHRQSKRHVLGLIPHYVDKADVHLENISRRYPKEIRLIDVQRNPLVVISEIDRCEFIISSSLHGLVAADALGIPNAWMVLSDKVIGKGFKFFDYASAFGLTPKPVFLTGNESPFALIKMTRPIPDAVRHRTQELDDIFRQLRSEFVKRG